MSVNTSEEYGVSLQGARVVSSASRRRLAIAVALSLMAFLVLVSRLWQLQVREGEYHRSLSENNRIRLHRVNATRGLVLDHRGRVLVENRPSFDIVIVPEDAREPERVITRLARFLGEGPEELQEAFRSAPRRPPFESVVLRKDVGWDALSVVETRQIELPGVSLKVEPRRSYLDGDLAGHLLGYVGEVSEGELRRLEGYRMRDAIGKSGLEKQWESSLRGENGGRQIEVDAFGRELRVLREVKEVPGANVHLTIDIDLQRAAADALEGVEGAVIALDPNTGAVRAMVSRPTFDPNLFAAGISIKDWRGVSENPLDPLQNRAIRAEYPPASIFKIVVAAAALEEGIVTPFSNIYCSGSYRYGNRDFRCWKPGGHGWVNLHRSLVQSCDVYYYQVSQRLGVNAIADYARRFGLGAPTGSGLEGEKGGIIPDRDWKRRRFGEPWHPGETLSVAIGQGYVTATPLQMAGVIAAIASGGIRHPPYFVEGVEVPDHENPVVARGDPKSLGLRPSTVIQIRNALRDVVESPGGTGRRAHVDGMEVGGKTGTSQVIRLRGRKTPPAKIPRKHLDHAWFVGFAPVEAPEIVVAVIVEHAGAGGGKIAAPIAQKVLAHYFGVGKEKEEASADDRQTARASH